MPEGDTTTTTNEAKFTSSPVDVDIDSMMVDTDGDGKPDLTYQSTYSLNHYWANGLSEIITSMNNEETFLAVLNEITLSSWKMDSASENTTQGAINWGKSIGATIGGTGSGADSQNTAGTKGIIFEQVFGQQENATGTANAATSDTSAEGVTTSSDTLEEQLNNNSNYMSATGDGQGDQNSYSGSQSSTLNAVGNITINFTGMANWKISKGHTIDFTQDWYAGPTQGKDFLS